MAASLPPPRGQASLVAALLVLSGAAALLHETAWFRLLVPVLGAGAIPGAVVAAGALVGIALGSAIGGRLADRAARPALVLALAELAAAGLGRLVPGAIRQLAPLAGAAALAVNAGLLGLAAIPWGVTLPAAVRTLAPSPDRVGRTFGRLYAWNTLGAVLGIALGATVLFEALGNRRTIDVACGAQAIVALVAMSLAMRRTPDPALPSVSAPPPLSIRSDHARPIGFVVAAMLAGAAGVGTQIAWTRRLTPILGATFPVFACVLALHLLGIALGTGLFGPRRGRRPTLAMLVLALLAAAGTAAMPYALGHAVEAVRPTWWRVYGDPLAMLGLRAAITAVLVLPGVLFGSALLPWFLRASAPDAAHAGRGSGRLVAANTLGSALGGLLVALVVVPAAGTAGALVACAGTILLAAAFALPNATRWALGLSGLLLTAVPFLRPIDDAAGSSSVGALYSVSAYRPDDVTTRLARDGVTASVLVRDREGRLEFWVEGSFESSTGPTDRLHLGLLGHLPLALFAARSDRPARVALIGLGGGLTAQAASRHHPAHLDVYELEPEVAAAAERFRDAGGGLPASATLHWTDGRRAILEGRESLDVISSDPIHPAVAGSAFLYAREFWQGAMARLSPEGVLVQWLPLYQIGGEDLTLAIRTFAASVPFPYVFVAGPDAMLVGSRTPLRLSPDRLARVLASEAGSELRALGFSTPGRLLGLLALDPDGCRALAGDGDLNTDDRLLLELRAGWREADDQAAAYALLGSIPADPRVLLDGPPGVDFEQELEVAGRLEAALSAWVRSDLPVAARRFTNLATEEPTNEFARRMRDEATAELAKAEVAIGDRDLAQVFARRLAAWPSVDSTLLLDAAEVLAATGASAEARAIAAPLAAQHGWPRAKRIARER